MVVPERSPGSAAAGRNAARDRGGGWPPESHEVTPKATINPSHYMQPLLTFFPYENGRYLYLIMCWICLFIVT